MACAVCSYALVVIDDGDGPVRYEHPVVPREDHTAAPVPAYQLPDAYRRCHICSQPHPMWHYQTDPIEAVAIGGVRTVVEEYSTRWHVCHDCAQLIDADDVNSLHRRSISFVKWSADRPEAQILYGIHRAVVLTRHPAKTLLTTTRWTPAVLKAATLPKVRDRLTGLLRGPIGLPRPLHRRTDRTVIADGLEHAHLYFVDAEFTALTAQVHTDLPATTLTDRIVPPAGGLLAWPNPVDHRHHLAAASWTRHGDGWDLLCYRSVGADLPGQVMPNIRHDIGWLLPVHAVRLPFSTVITSDDPLAALVTTWLLIAQQLAQPQPTVVDPSIRKAYQRSRRTPPEVRLVQIKARPTPPQLPRPTASSPSGRAKPDHRFWVTEHERNQAYGPGRSLRKAIIIEPFLKGDPYLPIKASTTIRVLGSTRRNRPRNDDV